MLVGGAAPTHARCLGRVPPVQRQDKHFDGVAAVSGVSLKFIKLGGLAALLKAATVCELRGRSVNVAGKMAESGIGSAAIVHAACVVPEVNWGISATHPYLAEDLVRTKLRLDADGAIALPTGGGLGVEVDERAVERLRVRGPSIEARRSAVFPPSWHQRRR